MKPLTCGAHTDPVAEPWACWRCGGRHARHHARCPNAGVNEGAPSRVEMVARRDAFLERYADACEERGDLRKARLIPGK